MSLKKANDFESQFYSWFDSGLKDILNDNRRRYRMELADKDERTLRGLSALPSTKSTSVVDIAVERALLDYHGDPEALSYTAKSADDPMQEQFAQWLTKVFHYRAEHTFPFFTWHNSSLTSAFTDGMEAALVTWKKEAYDNKETVYVDLLSGQQIDEVAYKEGVATDDLRFYKQDVINEVIVNDTWWIDQLKPGEQLLWDFKIPYMDINLGQVALVKIPKTVDQIMKLSDAGFFKKIKREEVEKYTSSGPTTRNYMDVSTTVTNPDTVDMDEYNRVELWYFFEKKDCQWYVTFSIEGKLELSKQIKVNDVFFGGRPVNRLPIVLGCTKLKLWETIGRGLPETIASIEDEWIDHRNNLNDAAKLAVQGKWRIEPDSDVYIDDILNARAFHARQGEVEAITQNFGLLENLRATDPLTADMNELIPVGMGSRSVVPKGTDKTLGATQLALQSSQDKLSVQLMVRNQTFMKPLMWLIAQLEFAYESDENILRIAGKQAGMNPPETLVDGKLGVDISVFDFDVNVQVNAGLGSAPRTQKVNNLMQIVQTGRMLNIPLDNVMIFNQLLTVAGYMPDQFINKQPPAPVPPQVEYKLDLKTTWAEVVQFAPELLQDLVKKYQEGQVEVKTTVDDAMLNEQIHNGQQALQTAENPIQDMTQGAAAMGMSQGGQQ